MTEKYVTSDEFHSTKWILTLVDFTTLFLLGIATYRINCLESKLESQGKQTTQTLSNLVQRVNYYHETNENYQTTENTNNFDGE